MKKFLIIPAIDLKGGKCVRLRQGLSDRETVYSREPLSMAENWRTQGAEWLHLVDLDGAFQGKPAHFEVIREIVGRLDIPVEVGGGLRANEDIRKMIDIGVARVIIGTRACESPDELAGLVEEFGSKLAVGIDARNGMVQVRGWTETTSLKAVDLAERINLAGVQTVIYTDTALDGMMQGPNIPGTAAMCNVLRGQVIASGGISSCEDIKGLCATGAQNLAGCIVGKALYEGTVTFRECRDAVPPDKQ